MVKSSIDPSDKYMIIKVPLQSILIKKMSTTQSNLNYINDKMQNAIERVNKIVKHTYYFLRAYILYLHNNNLPPVTFIKTDFEALFKMFIVPEKRGRKMKKDITQFTKFFDTEYCKIFDKKDLVIGTNLSGMLNYEATSMHTAFSNNMIVHFEKHIERYLYRTTKEKYNSIVDLVKNKELKKETIKTLNSELKLIKDDIFNNTNLHPELWSKWMIIEKSKLIPDDYNILENKDIELYPSKYLNY